MDNLFKITKAVACNYYYVPSLLELATLPNMEASKAKEAEEAELGTLKGKDVDGGELDEEKEKKVKIFFEYWYVLSS